eukprot:6181098-Pleurochrysis_carterae.AAC.1
MLCAGIERILCLVFLGPSNSTFEAQTHNSICAYTRTHVKLCASVFKRNASMQTASAMATMRTNTSAPTQIHGIYATRPKDCKLIEEEKRQHSANALGAAHVKLYLSFDLKRRCIRQNLFVLCAKDIAVDGTLVGTQGKNKTKFKPGGLRNIHESSSHKRRGIGRRALSPLLASLPVGSGTGRGAIHTGSQRPGSIIFRIRSPGTNRCRQVLSPTMLASPTKNSSEKNWESWHVVAKSNAPLVLMFVLQVVRFINHCHKEECSALALLLTAVAVIVVAVAVVVPSTGQSGLVP